MEESNTELLKAINNNLSRIVTSQEDIKEKLTTILMAIYDVDFNPNLEVNLNEIVSAIKDLK